MSKTEALFETQGAGRVYRSGSGAQIEALHDVSLTIPRGAFVVLRGPSGSGKTTLLALLAALDHPTKGTVRFDGQDLQRVSEAERSRIRRRLGIVFQQARMLRGLPLWENVTYPLIPQGVGGPERAEIATELLESVGIVGREGARPEELSGGELQRVGIARALVAEPEAVLADEPTSDLDSESAEAVIALLKGMHAAGRTVVAASHDPLLQELATHTFRLRAGRLQD